MQSSNHRQNFLAWAYRHNNPDDLKYSTISHALYVSTTGTIIFLLVTYVASNLIFSSECNLMQPQSVYFGYFLLIYLVFMIVSRYSQNGSVTIYQFLWACNQSLLIGAFSMIVQDSHLLRASIVLVSIDQLLWYVDILSYLIKRKFIIGVAKYIIWPQTTKLRLMTTFHHVWYIPLVLWLVAPSNDQCGLNIEVYFLCCIMSLALGLIGKISAPKQVTIIIKNKKQQDEISIKRKTVYLNLNLSWQLWKDVKLRFLQKVYEIIPPNLIPIFLSMFWSLGCLIGFAILSLIESLI